MWKSLFVTLLCYSLLVFSIFFSTQLFIEKPYIVKEKIVIIDRAEYIPIPEFFDAKKDINEVKSSQEINMKEVVANTPVIAKEIDSKGSGWEYKAQEKIDTSWRERISNLIPQKKENIESIKPIEISRNKDNEHQKKIENNGETNIIDDEREVLSYSKMIQIVIRNHWSVPEDIALKYGNNPVEVEIEIDMTGSLKSYRFKNSSGNNIYDASIREAIKKSFPLMPPPKKLFQKSFDCAKITIVFRL